MIKFQWYDLNDIISMTKFQWHDFNDMIFIFDIYYISLLLTYDSLNNLFIYYNNSTNDVLLIFYLYL